MRDDDATYMLRLQAVKIEKNPHLSRPDQEGCSHPGEACGWFLQNRKGQNVCPHSRVNLLPAADRIRFAPCWQRPPRWARVWGRAGYGRSLSWAASGLYGAPGAGKPLLHRPGGQAGSLTGHAGSRACGSRLAESAA